MIELFYSQTTSKLKCVGSPLRIIYTVFGKPPVSLLKLFDYIMILFNYSGCLKSLATLILQYAHLADKYSERQTTSFRRWHTPNTNHRLR